ncbi:sensor histidine kinase [Pseudaminobacter soli (ex Li et al. 2025)]|nr:HWE histidine kinase domain-containing protein [Mesorhizobium soli]
MDRLIRAYHTIFITNPMYAYAFAIGCVVIATLLRLAAGVITTDVAPFVTLFPAVLLAAVLGGTGPGTLALVLSGASAWYFFLEPLRSLEINTTATAIDLVLFALCGAAMILVGAVLQAAVERADRTLQDVREGERRLRAALEAGHLGTISYNLAQDRGRWSPAFAKMIGQPVTDMSFSDWLELVHPDDRHIAQTSLEEALATKTETYKTHYRIVRPDKAVRWLEFSVTATRDGTGELIGLDGFAVDVTDRFREDERKQEIVREMHHRVKNVLAIVQALARQTAHQATSLDGFLSTFQARLNALATTHDLIVSHQGRGVALAELVKTETAPFETIAGSRITLDGPDLMLPSEMITPLGLVIHELTTNAAKYGSLSHRNGAVSVNWSTRTNGGGPRLSVLWRERGGPPVVAPTKAGFGSRLISRMIRNDLAGEIEFHWLAQGLDCTFTVPLAN